MRSRRLPQKLQPGERGHGQTGEEFRRRVARTCLPSATGIVALGPFTLAVPSASADLSLRSMSLPILRGWLISRRVFYDRPFPKTPFLSSHVTLLVSLVSSILLIYVLVYGRALGADGLDSKSLALYYPPGLKQVIHLYLLSFPHLYSWNNNDNDMM